jgi:hypothetical protein
VIVGPLELLVLLILFGAAYLIARYARSKGYSFAGFFIFALLIWPVALVVALILRDRSGATFSGAIAEPATTADAEAATSSESSATSLSSGDRLAQLQQITDLRQAGTLSEEEFEAEKARIMPESGGD